MARKTLSYWIKVRDNPQLGTYYVCCGQMPKTEARRMEETRYGYNTMLEFKSKEDYEARIQELNQRKERVYDR